jgi:hypothetical protein
MHRLEASMETLSMPINWKPQQLRGRKLLAGVARFHLPLALLCIAAALAFLLYISNAVESPAIWQEPGIIP